MTNKELGEAYINGSGRLIQRVLETIEHTPDDIFTKEVVINLIHQTKELFDEQTKEMMG
ncbi:hypothetical protein LCGC14_0422400 [marine sediment metagenome]|uniref:Uncharacterized protein n=1 Tax=marine sediment metagenome TaxID=412755 RepID=A0A0F9SQN0_9ZZZZ